MRGQSREAVLDQRPAYADPPARRVHVGRCDFRGPLARIAVPARYGDAAEPGGGGVIALREQRERRVGLPQQRAAPGLLSQVRRKVVEQLCGEDPPVGRLPGPHLNPRDVPRVLDCSLKRTMPGAWTADPRHGFLRRSYRSVARAGASARR